MSETATRLTATLDSSIRQLDGIGEQQDELEPPDDDFVEDWADCDQSNKSSQNLSVEQQQQQQQHATQPATNTTLPTHRNNNNNNNNNNNSSDGIVPTTAARQIPMRQIAADFLRGITLEAPAHTLHSAASHSQLGNGRETVHFALNGRNDGDSIRSASSSTNNDLVLQQSARTPAITADTPAVITGDVVLLSSLISPQKVGGTKSERKAAQEVDLAISGTLLPIQAASKAIEASSPPSISSVSAGDRLHRVKRWNGQTLRIPAAIQVPGYMIPFLEVNECEDEALQNARQLLNSTATANNNISEEEEQQRVDEDTGHIPLIKISGTRVEFSTHSGTPIVVSSYQRFEPSSLSSSSRQDYQNDQISRSLPLKVGSKLPFFKGQFRQQLAAAVEDFKISAANKTGRHAESYAHLLYPTGCLAVMTAPLRIAPPAVLDQPLAPVTDSPQLNADMSLDPPHPPFSHQSTMYTPRPTASADDSGIIQQHLATNTTSNVDMIPATPRTITRRLSTSGLSSVGGSAGGTGPMLTLHRQYQHYYYQTQRPQRGRKPRYRPRPQLPGTSGAAIAVAAAAAAAAAAVASSTTPETYEPLIPYTATALDGPEMGPATHRTVMSLPGFVGSVIEYSTPYNFKRDLEEHFRRKHPDLDPHLTLTSIREIKSSMLTVTRSQDLELSTLAIATVFFEKLILAQHVHKANRKAMAATCMLLAFKVNEPKDTGKTLALLRDLEMELDSDHKRVTGMEFNVFAKLGFELYPAISEFMPHFERIFAGLEYRTMADYLGDTAFFVM